MLNPIDQSALEHYFYLPRRKGMASFKCTFASAIFDQDMTLRKFLAEIPQNEEIAAIELIVLSRIHKLQWEDSKIYQILPMHPGKLSGKNDTRRKERGATRDVL